MNMIPDMPAEHRGFVEKRAWHKIRWVKNPYPGRSEWEYIEGKFDLMTDEDLENFRNFVEVIKTIGVPKCETGLSLRFGATSEDEIDAWIKNHE